ncbi:hypothetical protein JYT22_01090 [Endomicrobium sp. AH-315-J14]|nr:hypothetical protein [Endomicrobium sp. AH-315-J14]
MSEKQPIVAGTRLAFGTPRKLPKAASLSGKVVVLDIAFAAEGGGRKNRFEKTTLRLIEELGDRLIAWIDHHDSQHHQRYADDPRFLLRTKAQHGACPEMITPELVASYEEVDTVLCHVDFDGLASAAKWILGGREPYPGCDDDARAIDTCVGESSDIGKRIDRALRARPRDGALMQLVVEHFVSGAKDEKRWTAIDEIGEALVPLERRARELAQDYRSLSTDLSFVDATGSDPYDKTLLLLLGQKRSLMAAVRDDDTVTFAAPFDSGVSFVERFGFSGGMPTVVSVPLKRLAECLRALDVDPDQLSLIS